MQSTTNTVYTDRNTVVVRFQGQLHMYVILYTCVLTIYSLHLTEHQTTLIEQSLMYTPDLVDQ